MRDRAGQLAVNATRAAARKSPQAGTPVLLPASREGPGGLLEAEGNGLWVGSPVMAPHKLHAERLAYAAHLHYPQLWLKYQLLALVPSRLLHPLSAILEPAISAYTSVW